MQRPACRVNLLHLWRTKKCNIRRPVATYEYRKFIMQGRTALCPDARTKALKKDEKGQKSKARRAGHRPAPRSRSRLPSFRVKFSTFAFSRDILSIHCHLLFSSSLNPFSIIPFSLSLSLAIARHRYHKLAGPDRLVDQARATSSTSPFIFNSTIICLHLGRLSGRPQTSRKKRLQAAVSVIYNDLPICAPFK